MDKHAVQRGIKPLTEHSLLAMNRRFWANKQCALHEPLELANKRGARSLPVVVGRRDQQIVCVNPAVAPSLDSMRSTGQAATVQGSTRAAAAGD